MLSSFVLLNGFILTTTSRNVCNTGASGVFALIDRKWLEGLQKISYGYSYCPGA